MLNPSVGLPREHRSSCGLAPAPADSLLSNAAMDRPLSRILHLLYRDTLNTDDLTQLAELSPLTESWRLLARHRFEHYVVED